jgi:hypothetical protein
MYGSAPEAVQCAVPRRSVILATTTMRRNASGVVREFHFPSAPSAKIAVNDTTITRRIVHDGAECPMAPPDGASARTGPRTRCNRAVVVADDLAAYPRPYI